MEVSHIHVSPDTVTSTAAIPYEPCDQCGAAVDRAQRYCVNCGTRRRHVHDPAARHLSRITADARTASRQTTARPVRRRGTVGLGTALALAAIPLAIGLGVLVGRASTNGDQKLLAELRAQRPTVLTVGGGTTAAGASSQTATAAALTSDFPLQSGWAIELQTLPASGTDQAAVTRAERAAKAKGAKSVGLITQSDFKVTPSPAADAYVIYSGAYKTQADARAALKKLANPFPHAKVIRVRSTGSSTSGAGKALSSSRYGTAHQITGFKPTQTQLQQGSQAVNKIQHTQGKSYLNSQRGLPDQISIP